MKSRKSWAEKLDNGKDRKIVPIPPRMERQLGKGTLLIPKPLDVDALVRKIPRGRVMTMGELRTELAHQYGADTTCPMCAGMFLRIVAEAAEEKGGKNRAPYWRVVRDDGKLNPKLPGGVEAQAEHLEQESVAIDRTAKALLVGGR